MKQFLSVCLVFNIHIALEGQDITQYAHIDEKALSIPLSKTYSSDSISAFVRSNFNPGKDRLRAIYTWVTANISYDTDSMYVINSDRDTDERVSATLRRRKGVCENYAAVFNDIASKSGIASYIVSGYTRQLGTIDRSGHAWCAVYVDNEWFFCDPTWDQGGRLSARWFLVPPSQFIGSHFPFDPLWQLLDHPISYNEFSKGNFYPGKERKQYNFSDSINAYLQLDTLQQLEAAIFRIQQAGPANELMRNRLTYLKMKAAIIYEEKNMNLYNSAVTDLNHAGNIFNEFIQYRNNRFIPAKSDREIIAMLSPVDSILTVAGKKTDQIVISQTNSQYDPSLLKEQLKTFSGKVKDQKDFLKEYFLTPSPERGKLFYK